MLQLPWPSQVQSGMITQVELQGFEGELVDARDGVDSVEQLLTLRAEFMAGRLTAKAVELAERVYRSHRDVMQARRRVGFAERALERHRRLVAVGDAAADTSMERELARAQAALSVYEVKREALLLEANGVPAEWLQDPFVDEIEAQDGGASGGHR